MNDSLIMLISTEVGQDETGRPYKEFLLMFSHLKRHELQPLSLFIIKK